ncbi:MAG: hypothetical protein RMJ19_05630 [Gemmatales bacterium]|nr:hypothetical protein [Gemmatales bacterium]MDW8175134.1 hypothetical protein [Gemmatales bacterium]
MHSRNKLLDTIDRLSTVIIRHVAWRVRRMVEVLERYGPVTMQRLQKSNEHVIRSYLEAVAQAYGVDYSDLAEHVYREAMRWKSEPIDYFADRVARNLVERLGAKHK